MTAEKDAVVVRSGTTRLSGRRPAFVTS